MDSQKEKQLEIVLYFLNQIKIRVNNLNKEEERMKNIISQIGYVDIFFPISGLFYFVQAKNYLRKVKIKITKLESLYDKFFQLQNDHPELEIDELGKFIHELTGEKFAIKKIIVNKKNNSKFFSKKLGIMLG